MITLVVGDEKKRLNAHRSILYQSPVLERMCPPASLEGITETVNLSDDRADLISHLLRYLYSGTLRVCSSVITDPGNLEILADLYILGENYQVYSMQKDLLKNFAEAESTLVSVQNSFCFFKMSQHIYANVPQSNRIFRDHFISAVPPMIKSLKAVERLELGVLVYMGGAFAQDVYIAQCELVVQSTSIPKPSLFGPNNFSTSATTSIPQTSEVTLKPSTYGTCSNFGPNNFIYHPATTSSSTQTSSFGYPDRKSTGLF